MDSNQYEQIRVCARILCSESERTQPTMNRRMKTKCDEVGRRRERKQTRQKGGEKEHSEQRKNRIE